MSYQLMGSILEVRECKVLCPCWIGEDPDNGTWRSALAYHYEQGSIGGVDVSRVTVAFAADRSRMSKEILAILFVVRARRHATSIGSVGRGCLNERANAIDGFYQVCGRTMPRLQVARRVVREPHAAIAVLPHQHLEWQIERRRRHGLHQRSPGPRITEHEQLRRLHHKPRALRIRRKINAREQDDVLRFDQGCEFIGRLLDRPVRGHSDDAVIGRFRKHGLLGLRLSHGHVGIPLPLIPTCYVKIDQLTTGRNTDSGYLAQGHSHVTNSANFCAVFGVQARFAIGLRRTR